MESIKIKKKSYFENKIVIVSFLLSILVVYIHANFLKYYSLEENRESIAYWVVRFIAGGIAGNAVPMFFIISGYLFFRNITDSSNIKLDIRKKQLNRIKTIGIPYLFWNIFGMLFYMTIPRIPAVNNIMNGSYVEITLKNIFNGIIFHEYYFPFWYLKELIIIISLAQIIGFILSNKNSSILTLIILTMIYIFNTNITFLYSYSLYFFFLGAFIATYGKEFFENKQKLKVSVFLICIFILLSIVRILSSNHLLVQLAYIISPMILWGAVDSFVSKIKITWIMNQSFFIYCSHIIIVTTIGKIFCKLINTSQEIWIILSFLVTPIVTLIIIYLISIFLNKYFKSFYRIICGNRI